MSALRASRCALLPLSRARALSSVASSGDLLVEPLGGALSGTTVLTLSRGASRNAIGRSMLAALSEALGALRFDGSVRAVIVRSAVPGVFCAGADLKERAGMAPGEVAAFVAGLRGAFSALARLPQPVIAAVDGAALGGGAELALACDLRVAGADASFALPETGLAIIPGAGGCARLPRVIGLAAAKELIFTGRRVGAAEAAALGLVSRSVAPAGGAFDAACRLAADIVSRGPLAVRAAKQALDMGAAADVDTALAVEAACYGLIIPTADRLEGLRAFRDKRAPVYKGE